MVNILFNLHLKLGPDSKYRQVSKDFVKELFRTYQDYISENSLHRSRQQSSQHIEGGDEGDLANHENSLTESIFTMKNLVQRKIIALAASASAQPENHRLLIKEGFYEQFKANLSNEHARIRHSCYDNELYAIVNIALNPKYLKCMWQDLRLIYKIVSKNTEVIEFKTKVDLFSACAAFITQKSLESHQPPKQKGKKFDG